MLKWQLRHYADIVVHNPIQAVSTVNPALANLKKDFAFGHYYHWSLSAYHLASCLLLMVAQPHPDFPRDSAARPSYGPGRDSHEHGDAPRSRRGAGSCSRW
jgi:hypothetical protein